MTDDEALEAIRTAVARVRRRQVVVPADADLVEDGILDSLEGMAFALEIEEAAGLELPQDADLAELGVYRVPELVRFLRAGRVVEAS